MVEGEEKTPITTLVQFEPTHQEKCSATASFASLNEKLFKKFTQPKFIYAIKLEGVFSSLAIRSETPQPKPYQPMDKSFLPTQRKFKNENIQGTLVGFYIPDYFQRLLLPGFHFHFLSADETCGGHVLDFSFQEATVTWQTFSNLQLFLPQGEAFQQMDLSNDTENALQVAEKGK